MIKHLVFFKFSGELSRDERINKAESMKALFLPLAELPSVKEYRLGINISESDSAWDLVIDSCFESPEKLKEYSVSKEHQDAIHMAKRFDKEKSVVDYEI